jgi:hypothetical protein
MLLPALISTFTQNHVAPALPWQLCEPIRPHRNKVAFAQAFPAQIKAHQTLHHKRD